MDNLNMQALSAMLPPALPQPVKSRMYSNEEWAKHQDFIAGVYPLEGMTNKKIVAMLSEERGERQLKRELDNWDLQKKVRSDKMKAIAKKLYERKFQGKETTFRFRGKVVKPWDINRWQKRSKNGTPSIAGKTRHLRVSPFISFSQPETDNVRTSAAPSTPSDISYCTIGSPATGISENGFLPEFEGQSPAPFTSPSTPVALSKGLSDTANKPLPENYTMTFSPAMHTVIHGLLSPLTFWKKFPHMIPLTMTLGRQSRFKAADRLHQRVARTWRRIAGENDSKTLLALSNAANVLAVQGQLSASEQLNRSVHAEAVILLQPSDPNLLLIESNLTRCLMRSDKDSGTTEKLLREIVRHGGEVLEPNHQVRLDAWENLAFTLSWCGTYDESLKILRTLLKTIEVSQPDEPRRLRCLGDMGKVHNAMGQFQEAEKLLGQVAIEQGIVFGAEHENTLRNTLPELQKIIGNKHYSVVDHECDLARCLNTQSQYAEAESLARKVLSVAKSEFGPENMIICNALVAIGFACHGQLRSTEGLDLLGKAAEMCVRIFGPEHKHAAFYKSRHAGIAQDIANAHASLQTPVLIDSWQSINGTMRI
ncbi:uncharacterized protein PAC_16008 [Phialocephala subalpina]|uniref:Clr5 domain-containing protein n=1 Tax=Phialocephala subalpina TaxID=576137 RepID=A0A1L7XME1_9HELO|nr:uncharacterized protein PAC_16008 [Phialocephala subalpina]